MFINKELTKSDLNLLLKKIMENYNYSNSLKILDDLKLTGFKFATLSGFSLSLEDFIFFKNNLLLDIFYKQTFLLNKYNNFWLKNKIQNSNIFAWTETNNKLKNQILSFFKNFNPFNKIFLMANSGARGSFLQVSQMIGFRGLMSDPSGEPVKYSIKHSFKEGLNLVEYLIAAFGSRKGIVDTALGTAESGYLTRRLVEFSYNVIIRSRDCNTKFGFLIKNFRFYSNKILSYNLLIKKLNNTKTILKKNIIYKNIYTKYVPIKTVLTCRSNSFNSICQFCFGLNLSTQKLISLGTPIGIISAQSISEPSTQMTMRTFHTGGIFGSFSYNKIPNSIGFLTCKNNSCYFFNWSNYKQFFSFNSKKNINAFWVGKQRWLKSGEDKQSSIATNFELIYNKKTNVILLEKIIDKLSIIKFKYFEGKIHKQVKKNPVIKFKFFFNTFFDDHELPIIYFLRLLD